MGNRGRKNGVMEYWSSRVIGKNKTAGRVLVTSLYLIIVLLLPPVGVRAAVLEKLTIGWSAIAGSQAPFWITKEAGLFEKNGLDVTMIYVDGGSKATQALMSGDVPIAQVGGNAHGPHESRGENGCPGQPAEEGAGREDHWPGHAWLRRIEHRRQVDQRHPTVSQKI